MKWWIWQELKYSDQRTPEVIAEGEKLLRRLKRKQKKALATYKAKHDPPPVVPKVEEKVLRFPVSQR